MVKLRTVDTDRLLQLCRRDLTFDLVRGAGPGGQNVNKVATAVQLRFDVRNSPRLVKGMKDRLIHLAGRRMTSTGVLIIEARRYRTQKQNREDAIARFTSLVRRSVEEPTQRTRTQPSAGSKERRLQAKKQRGEIKRTRRRTDFD